MTRLGNDGPSTAMIPIASRMNGNASWASATVITISSTHPPRNPATSPSRPPTMPPTATAANPIVSDTRVPNTIRDSTSRPSWSVPRRWALPSAASRVGPLSRARSEPRSGLCGAISGAAIATTARNAMNAAGGVERPRQAPARGRARRRQRQGQRVGRRGRRRLHARARGSRTP